MSRKSKKQMEAESSNGKPLGEILLNPEILRTTQDSIADNIRAIIHDRMDSGLTLDQALYILKLAKDKVRQYTPPTVSK